MPPSWLGLDDLGAVLENVARAVISNRAAPGRAIEILSAAVALHDGGGSTRLHTAHGLELGPGRAKVLEIGPPSRADVLGAEVVLRLLVGQDGQLVDAYARVEGTQQEPLGTVEFGVVETGEEVDTNVSSIAGTDEFMIFARSEA